MKEETKNGYIAGGVLLITGLLFIANSITNGWSPERIVFSSVLCILGMAGIMSPDKWGTVLAHWLKRFDDKAESKTFSQKGGARSRNIQAENITYVEKQYNESEAKRR